MALATTRSVVDIVIKEGEDVVVIEEEAGLDGLLQRTWWASYGAHQAFFISKPFITTSLKPAMLSLTFSNERRN